MKQYVTRGDIVLVGILTLLSFVSLGSIRYLGFSGSHAVVEVDGRRALELPLDRDVTTAVNGPLGETVVRIENGAVSVLSSPCPHGHCKHMGRIRHAGEILVCVPNRVFVSIRGKGNGKEMYDGVSE